MQFSYPKTETFVVVAVDFDDELKNNWYYTDQRLKYLKPLKGHHIQHNSKFWPLGQNILVSGILFYRYIITFCNLTDQDNLCLDDAFHQIIISET